MTSNPTAQEVMEFRAATDCGVNEAKELLITWDRTRIEKVLEAARIYGRLPLKDLSFGAEATAQEKTSARAEHGADRRHLVDPMESDAVHGPIVKDILEEERQRIRDENAGEWKLGSCHLIWQRAKTRLFTEHKLEWHSPADLNPGSVFD